ncbi:MAG: 4-hydroxy-3-methylbut-2-enyl diphosphate reductase, partial [Lachnospiraceae bacterium]|nr:4-hydroxy-3-methylbut-2-enyl diphosphate reductase [Lachnospiraceae bacterium]
MNVELAKYAGFCFGVKRAVDTVQEQLKTGKTIYTYGPIVHNEEVVRELQEQGVRVLNSKEELLALAPKEGEHVAVVIRAHGVPKEIVGIIESKGIE